MTPEVQTALIAGGSAVVGGLVAAASTYLGVARQLEAQRQRDRRREQFEVATEFVEASTLYMDEYEYWISGLEDLLERGGPERVDAQRDKLDDLNTSRRSAYARLALVCSKSFLDWLSSRLAEVQDDFEAGMYQASEEADPARRLEIVKSPVTAYGDFIDEVLIRLRSELDQDS